MPGSDDAELVALRVGEHHVALLGPLPDVDVPAPQLEGTRHRALLVLGGGAGQVGMHLVRDDFGSAVGGEADQEPGVVGRQQRDPAAGVVGGLPAEQPAPEAREPGRRVVRTTVSATREHVMGVRFGAGRGPRNGVSGLASVHDEPAVPAATVAVPVADRPDPPARAGPLPGARPGRPDRAAARRGRSRSDRCAGHPSPTAATRAGRWAPGWPGRCPATSLVLGLPRGGAVVAAGVAAALGAPLDVLLVRKLGLPGQPELAMGAVAAIGDAVETVRSDGRCSRPPVSTTPPSPRCATASWPNCAAGRPPTAATARRWTCRPHRRPRRRRPGDRGDRARRAAGAGRTAARAHRRGGAGGRRPRASRSSAPSPTRWCACSPPASLRAVGGAYDRIRPDHRRRGPPAAAGRRDRTVTHPSPRGCCRLRHTPA